MPANGVRGQNSGGDGLRIHRERHGIDRFFGNTGFFSDLHTRRFLEEGLIDITASDAHNLRERPTRMLEAYEKLKEDYDGVYAANLTGLSRKEELWQTLIAAK